MLALKIRFTQAQIYETVVSEISDLGQGLSYLVQSLNQKTQIKTQLVEAVHMKDAAFFQTPILFMEPVSGGSKISPEHKEEGARFPQHSNLEYEASGWIE